MQHGKERATLEPVLSSRASSSCAREADPGWASYLQGNGALLRLLFISFSPNEMLSICSAEGHTLIKL